MIGQEEKLPLTKLTILICKFSRKFSLAVLDLPNPGRNAYGQVHLFLPHRFQRKMRHGLLIMVQLLPFLVERLNVEPRIFVQILQAVVQYVREVIALCLVDLE